MWQVMTSPGGSIRAARRNLGGKKKSWRQYKNGSISNQVEPVHLHVIITILSSAHIIESLLYYQASKKTLGGQEFEAMYEQVK